MPDLVEEVAMMACPFCREDDFDRSGLANHLRSWCEAYQGALDEFDTYEEISRARHRAALHPDASKEDARG